MRARCQHVAFGDAIAREEGTHGEALLSFDLQLGEREGAAAAGDLQASATGARDALVFAMYHPAAALRTQALEQVSFEDIARVPAVLITSRERRAAHAEAGEPAATPNDADAPAPAPAIATSHVPAPAAQPAKASASSLPVESPAASADDASQLTLF